MLAGQIAVGHPVDVATGAQFTAWHDVELPGHVPLVWRRFYNTALLQAPVSVLGRGWVHFFDVTLSRNLEGFAFYGHDGSNVDFHGSRELLEAGGSIFNFGSSMELRLEGDSYAVYHWHSWQAEVRIFLFCDDGSDHMRLSAIRIPSGHGLVLEYDDRGRLFRVRQTTEGRGVRLRYQASGLLAAVYITSPVENDVLLVSYEHDLDGRLVVVRNANGVPIRYAYDTGHRLTKETTRLGGSFEMRYDQDGRCIEAAGASGYRSRKLTFDTAGRKTSVADSAGNVTVYQWNERGQVELELLPNGGRRVKTFDQFGRIASITEPSGKTTKRVYGERGDLIKTIYSNGAASEYEFNTNHQVTRITNPSGGTWTLTYERGALVSVQDPCGAVTRYTRDPQNCISSILTPSGNTIRITRDSTWSAETYSDDLGVIRFCEYDYRLNVTSIADSKGLQRRLEYDALGRLVRVIENNGENDGENGGATRHYQRGEASEILRYVDETGLITACEYSPYGEILSVADPNGLTQRFEFDLEGRVIRIRNPKGELACFAYDSVGNLIRQVSFDGRTDRFEFEPAGKLIRRIKPDDVTLDYRYDIFGHLLAISHEDELLVAYEYDRAGHLIRTETPENKTTYAYDLCGRIIAETQNEYRVEYEYHPSGDLARRHFSGAGIPPLSFRYDQRGRLIAIAANGHAVQSMSYDGQNLLITRDFGQSFERRRYDLRKRLISQEVLRKDGDLIVSRKFIYDGRNNLVHLDDSLRGASAYIYDPGERLVESRSASSRALDYEYDASGNLLRNDEGRVLSFGAGNRLLSVGATTYESDANGNIVAATSESGTARYTWNQLDQLVAVTDDNGRRIEFTYDGSGRRLSAAHNGESTRFFWSGDNLLSEVSGSEVTDYVIASHLPDIIWRNGQIMHVVRSFTESPQELISDKGELLSWAIFRDWGSARAFGTAGFTQLRLPGQYHDNQTNLHYNRFRYYDPESGRFLSPDPLGLGQGLNEYRYAPNPINWCDPLGLECGNKNCPKNSVYVLTKGDPPEIVYVGITAQTVEERLAQHANNPDKDFDNMTVIATGLGRRDARNIEGSALYNIGTGQVVSANTGLPFDLQNATRNDGLPYHSYGPGTPHTLFSPAQSANQLNQDIRTLPKP